MTPAEARAKLAAVSDTPDLDVRVLREYAGGDDALFDSYVARRLRHEPAAYITGTRDFWTITLNVTPAVLIPRPDSETLLDAAVAHFGAVGPRRILDLGTGSGALLLAALDQWPGATGLGVDQSAAALAVAHGNAVANGLADRATFARGNWAAGIDSRFDLVLCNPPYVEDEADLPPDVRDHEPHAALFAGHDGLDDYRRIVPRLPALFAPGGIACVEIGMTQGDAVSTLAATHDLAARRVADLAGRDRCLVLWVK